MTEIDELLGQALAGVVARSQGWEMRSGHWVDYSSGACVWIQNVISYRPDINIAQAWELGADWHGWHSEEHYDYTRKTYFVFTFVCLPHHIDSIQARCDYKTTDEKSEAYATARCRAFLKAKEAPDD